MVFVIFELFHPELSLFLKIGFDGVDLIDFALIYFDDFLHLMDLK